MMNERASRLLTVNTGSSSVKAAVYQSGETPQLEVLCLAERVGRPEGRFRVADAAGLTLVDETKPLPDHSDVLLEFLSWLQNHRFAERLAGVGHRVVHGGMRFWQPTLITPTVVSALGELIPIDPDHLPQAIDAIETVGRVLPDVAQVACFDTAFHRHMPRVAQIYALPRSLAADGVLRYGFHGLSYESILEQLTSAGASNGRTVIAHLGNGSSMVAVRDGRSVDTTMGFTPTGGLAMGTRCGDLDPGVLLYLLQVRRMSPDDLNTLVNKESGLLGVSASSPDMHDLLDREEDDPRAAEAVALYCYQAAKFLGAMATAMGGLDTLIFTAGIGEHAAPVRERICAGLGFLGICLDADRNRAGDPVISTDSAPVTVRAMHTDEDLMIARHTLHLLREGEKTRV